MSQNPLTGKWADKKIFTTGEAADVCKVSQQTIIRCFDAGRLGGFRVPGSKFRRIPRAELIKFMQSNEIPTEVLDGGIKRVLIVDDDAGIVALMRDVLGESGKYEIRSASTGYEAGMLTESFRPHVILLDYMLPDVNGPVVCQRLREREDLRETKIIVISGVVSQEELERMMSAGADDFLKKPFNVHQLLEKLQNILAVEA